MDFDAYFCRPSAYDAPQLTDEQCAELIACLKDAGADFDCFTGDHRYYPVFATKKDLVLNDVHMGIKKWFSWEHVGLKKPSEVRDLIEHAASALSVACNALYEIQKDGWALACACAKNGRYAQEREYLIERCFWDCAELAQTLDDEECKPEVKRGGRRKHGQDGLLEWMRMAWVRATGEVPLIAIKSNGEPAPFGRFVEVVAKALDIPLRSGAVDKWLRKNRLRQEDVARMPWEIAQLFPEPYRPTGK